MFLLIFWILIFILSLTVLVKSSDWFIESAEKIALALKISPFIIGVTIVAVGTSFPELASSLAAVLKGANEIVVANVVGSNIANIFLIVGLSAVAGGILIVKRSLIDLDAPLLAASTALLVFVSLDKTINLGEAVLLLIAFLMYIFYTISQRQKEAETTPEIREILPEEEIMTVLPSRIERREEEAKTISSSEKINLKVIFFLILGLVGIVIGADYTIESVVKVAEILKILPGLIGITAVAVGTSLPELMVSVRAAFQKKYEISLGNIFGSNIFNGLVVTALPILIKPLVLDTATFYVGLPFLGIATTLFIISGISRRIHKWEGIFYLILYCLFIAKLFNWF